MAVASAMKRMGMRSSTKSDADVFVVTTPGAADGCVSAGSAMRGSYQVSPMLMTSGGSRGAAVKFGQVSHMRKTVYFSLSFLTHQHKFCAFFQVLVGTVAGCKWRVRTTDWPTLKATVKHPDLFALLRSGE